MGTELSFRNPLIRVVRFKYLYLIFAFQSFVEHLQLVIIKMNGLLVSEFFGECHSLSIS